MKISLNPIQYFDLAGVPLTAGRLKIYLHGSDNLANTYIMDGTEFIEGPNPVMLDNSGEQPNTIFLDAAIYDVHVEKLVDGFYAKISDFQFGFEMPSASNSTIANGMDALANTNPEVGIVTVVGYDSEVYAGPRTYIWDPTCTDNADGGCIVASETTENGRWLLLSDLRELPCTYYGIKPGREANVSAFLTYQETVGQWGIQMPPVPRFLSGSYTSTGTFSVTKTIMFDKGAQFRNAVFECPDVEIPEWDDYVADFYISDNNAVVHSSWFKTVAYFLTCDSDHLVFDDVNYFVNNTISAPFTFNNKVIEAHARLPVVYVNSGRLEFDGCSFLGVGFFNSTDIVRFAHTVFKQEWFTIPQLANWDFVSKIFVRSVSLDTILLDNFSSPEVYVKAMEADGKTEVDLAGRTISSITTTQLTTIRNAVCTGNILVNEPLANVVLDNVTCQSVSVECNTLTVYRSRIMFVPEPACTVVYAFDSDVSSQYAVTNPTVGFTMERCRVGISFNRGADNTTKDYTISLYDCTLYANVSISSKSLAMHNCTTSNATIKAYPYLDNEQYHIDLRLVDNNFFNANPVEITKVDDDNCHSCIANWVIVGNSFVGNNEGVRCRYWSNRTGTQYDKPFIVPDIRSVIEYSGNSGKCPAESCKGAGMPGVTQPWRTVDIGTGNIYLYTYTLGRVCPKYDTDEAGSDNYKLYRVATPGPETVISTDFNDDLNISARTGAVFWQTARAFDDRDGDFFVLGFALWVSQATSNETLSVV